MRNSESAHLFSLNLNYNCGFYSSIYLIQSGQTKQTNKQTHTHTTHNN